MKKYKLITSVILSCFILVSGTIYAVRFCRQPEVPASWEASLLVTDLQEGGKAGKKAWLSGILPIWEAYAPRPEAGRGAAARDGLPNGGEAESRQEQETANASMVYAHICGAVKKPGVYSLGQGARVRDFILLAGGLTGEAAGDFVNQAAMVSDGERLYIPDKEEAETMGFPESGQERNAAFGSGTAKTEKASGKAGAAGPVNINTAPAEVLMTLPGIGQAKASGIIRYREENGSFKSTEELMKIEGIKEGVFEKIRDLVIIN